MEYIDKYVWYQEGPGVRKQQYTLDGVKLLNVANLVDGEIDLSTSHRYISEEEASTKYKHFLVDEGDLIIASSGIQVDYFEKKMGFAKKEHLPLCMNTSTIRFKSLDSKITNINYFMWFLKSDIFKAQLRKLITGSAQLNFGPSHLKKIKINMPSLKEQQDIVKELDKVQEVIDIKNKQIRELDKFIKSQFVEMFGDPILNDKNFPVVKIESIASKEKNSIKAGPFGSSLKKEFYVKRGYKIYGQEQVIGEDISFGDYYINEDKFNELKACEIKENDILISLVGTYGKILIVPNIYEKGIINPRLMKISPDLEIINPYFFKILFGFMSEVADNSTHGGTMGILNVGIVKNMKIILPDMEIQKEFINIVKLIDKQKIEIQKSLEETQKLQESLMNKYFS